MQKHALQISSISSSAARDFRPSVSLETVRFLSDALDNTVIITVLSLHAHKHFTKIADRSP